MKLSIILPTYNNEKTFYECLKSLTEQDFPKKEYEILVLDGGSTDKTLEIARRFPVKIIKNPKKSEEPARILGISLAKGEILAFIDADNVVPGKDWISKMLKPFQDKEIAFADTLYFSYRKRDPMKVRYQALIGGDDPLAAYLGLYSRWCYFKNDWTDFPYSSEKKQGYSKAKLTNPELVPAMGSNGFFIRKIILKKIVKDSFIHSDIVYDLVNKGYNCFAKVDTGIVHLQPNFFGNKVRRILRRMKNEVKIKYNYNVNKQNAFRSALRLALIFPIFLDMIKGYKKKPDSAWLFHFPATLGLMAIHLYYNTISKFFINAKA